MSKTSDFMIAASHVVPNIAYIKVFYRYSGLVMEDDTVRVSDIRLYERGEIDRTGLLLRWVGN